MTDKEKMQGDWACEAGWVGGKPLPEDTVQKLKLTLTQNGRATLALTRQVRLR